MGIKKFAFILLLLPVIFSCETKGGKKHKKKEKMESISLQEEVTHPKELSAEMVCDTSLWKYVYNPERLQVIDQCKTVTGVIEESNADEDGDQHMLLKLDGEQDDLLTKRNLKKKQGDLVIEAVCVNNVLLKKVGNTCKGYINHIQLPELGEHVKVTGVLVVDSHNGWSEIHPITKLEKIKS
jgi:hypothetical protein